MLQHYVWYREVPHQRVSVVLASEKNSELTSPVSKLEGQAEEATTMRGTKEDALKKPSPSSIRQHGSHMDEDGPDNTKVSTPIGLEAQRRSVEPKSNV